MTISRNEIIEASNRKISTVLEYTPPEIPYSVKEADH